MTVKEYLFTAGIDAARLAEILGYKSKATVTKRLDDEMHERWTRKLEEMSDLGIVPESAAETGEKSDDESERESKLTDEQINEWIANEGRADDKDPSLKNVQPSGNEVIGPQQIKLSTIEGYIKMVYGGAESLARSNGDMIAAEVIHKYTDEYTEAWIDYIKYDSRILKYLEMLQIGTPLGNLVGIHAISVGAYVLARVTAREIAAAHEKAERDAAEERSGFG